MNESGKEKAERKNETAAQKEKRKVKITKQSKT